MSRPTQLPKPPSLAQLFDAPEGLVGHFGWLCGYSADAAFLNDAVERFVRHTSGQRAHLGRIALGAMLNPGNVQITPVDVPGVMHLAYVAGQPKPFRLLHAKVAVLGYREENNPSQWLLRIIVSTGNWTRATLEQNLDLAWHLDIAAQDLKAQDDAVRQARADINATWGMLKWLRGFFDTRVFTDAPPGRSTTETRDAYQWFEELLDSIPNPRGILPRVFDSRHAALVDQLPELVKTHCSPVTRNYFGMGSGFFESTQDSGRIPNVLDRTAQTLQEAGLLTKSPEVDIFVNPRGCQAVAESFKAIRERGWSVREAYKPEFFSEGEIRSLHAKFLLSANSRTKSPLCSSAWVYLGSGNLTAAGFAQKMSENGGNLEVGVVLPAGELYWEPTRGVPPNQLVYNVLPVQWDGEFAGDGVLSSGSPFVLPEDTFVAAPLPYLLWVFDGDQGVLKSPSEVDVPFDVLDSAEVACDRRAPMLFVWTGERPRQVLLRWVTGSGSEHRAFVPVLDEFGRVAATKLAQMDVDDVWRQLQSFPMPPDEEDIPPPDDPPPDGHGRPTGGSATLQAVVYPIRRMMQLVENIAARQTSVPPADWTAWCIRLEQSLCQAANSRVAASFQTLGLNPISPLWQKPFRPTFAETSETPEGRTYEDALKRVESTWGMCGLKQIGEPA